MNIIFALFLCLALCFSIICKEDPDTKNSRSEIHNFERIRDLTYHVDDLDTRLRYHVSNFSTFVHNCDTYFKSFEEDIKTIQKELKNYKKSLDAPRIQTNQTDSGVQKQFSSLEQRISVIEDGIKKMMTFAFNERIELLEKVVPANQHACDRNQERTITMVLNIIITQSLMLTIPAVYGIYAIFSSILKKYLGCHDIYASSSRLRKISKVSATALGFSAVSVGVYIALYKALLACTIGRIA